MRSEKSISEEEHRAFVKLNKFDSSQNGPCLQTKCRTHFLPSLLAIPNKRLRHWEDSDKLIQMKTQTMEEGKGTEDYDNQEMVEKSAPW